MNKGLIVHSVLFNNNQEVLIIRRSLGDSVLPGEWDIPGGTLEDGEDPMIGALRETKEETGIDINHLDLFSFTSNVDTEKDKQFVRLIFIGNVGNNTRVVLNEEDHDKYQWVSLFGIYEDTKLVDYLSHILNSLEKKQHQLIQFEKCTNKK